MMRPRVLFVDRADAGRQLAAALSVQPIDDPVVLAVPRGGVAVAVEVARALGAKLDLLFVRKIGAPQNREVAIGAIAGSDAPQLVLNEELVASCGASQAYIEAEAARQKAEIARQRKRYLAGRLPVDLNMRHVIVVDDGVATGATLAAALKALRLQSVASTTLAIPVAPPEALEALGGAVDRIVCLHKPGDFCAVGLCYRDFLQVSDEEVIRALAPPDVSGRTTTDGS
ncbi:predicted phosphoribosyltransferase [Rhizobium subbaraonis]|uniref:Predicted phosphoribosyltransferase n=1 Tax=Rhizobium subbaraonis TaxID=908946 RepID=A0A285UQL5_9HYPH|nr:phosphoribosyltransferase family protein [Rhizobium subbaraonis]SOC44122.1 predicted phosphoribosyltransferase [Rhizobium subbaraonis]